MSKKKKHSSHQGPYLEILDWDRACKTDFLTGKGFEITEPALAKKQQKSKSSDEDGGKKNKLKKSKSMYGIWSPLFCSDWSDENAFEERYSCACGEKRGKIYEGEVCSLCNTKIIFRDVDLKMTGWLILHDYFIIHPIYYNKLASIIGKTTFADIINYDKKINRDGHIEDKEKLTGPYSGIGIIEFKERFHEIIEYYKKKKKGKKYQIEEIENDKKKIFASCIPVYSSVLRSAGYKGESLFYSKIDRLYMNMYSLSHMLNDSSAYEKKRAKWSKDKRERMEIPNLLSKIQEELMKLYLEVFHTIDQKEGHIKGEILGGMVDYSSRNVIVPDPTLKANEVILSYHTFLELYRYEIIACLVKMEGITEAAANEQWFKAKIRGSNKIYEVMKYIIKTKRHVLVNRNPTINYGSLICMVVKDVKNDFDNYTLSVPIPVLASLNADFDGDIQNIISCKTKSMAKAYNKAFNPKTNMYISRNDGLFNNDYGLHKDQIIGIVEFNLID